MDAIQKKKILSLDITLKRLRAKGPSPALNSTGVYWTFEREAGKVSCGVFQAGKRWVFATIINTALPGPQAKAIMGRLRAMAYYDADLDEVIRVCNRKAKDVRQIVDEILGRATA